MEFSLITEVAQEHEGFSQELWFESRWRNSTPPNVGKFYLKKILCGVEQERRGRETFTCYPSLSAPDTPKGSKIHWNTEGSNLLHVSAVLLKWILRNEVQKCPLLLFLCCCCCCLPSQLCDVPQNTILKQGWKDDNEVDKDEDQDGEVGTIDCDVADLIVMTMWGFHLSWELVSKEWRRWCRLWPQMNEQDCIIYNCL